MTDLVVIYLLFSGNFLWVDWTGAPHKVGHTGYPVKALSLYAPSGFNEQLFVLVTQMQLQGFVVVACWESCLEFESKMNKLY